MFGEHITRQGSLALLLAGFSTLLAACSDGNNTASGNSELQTPSEVVNPPGDPDFPGYSIVEVEAGEGFEERLLETLITADPMTIVQLPAGSYDLAGELSITVNSIVLRGAGMDTETGTELNFLNQVNGSQGILATGDNFVVQDLAVLNTPGDGIKVKGTDHVTIQRVRVEWTNGPDTDNGAYGLYPVQTSNVLIEDTEVRGASDAGVYVGQSENIIVRRNYVYENVAGIEIENSKFADVYDNETTANTGGILVFDLPGPPIQGGEATRVFNNLVYDNNTPNFAPEGAIVGTVPAGTGIMILANDDIEVFDNIITGNISTAVNIVSYYITDIGVSKPTYDPVPEKIFIHDNEIKGNGTDPQDLAALISGFVFGNDMVDIFYDSSGVGTDAGLLLEYPDGLSEDQRICIINNGPESEVGRANASVLLAGLPDDPDISRSDEDYDCTHASLPEIVLDVYVPEGGDRTEVDTETLCASTDGINNLAAYEANCPNLSDYRLFADSADATQGANGGYVYDLTSPLFTDYAVKYRFVFVPEGATAAYRAESVFDFPVGTIITKTFAIKSDHRDPDSFEEVLETRLLIHRKEGWEALPYIWNNSMSDAVLDVTGSTRSVSWIDEQGIARSTDYVIPNANNCANCHGEDAIQPIGPKARLLNRNNVYDGVTANQIQHWADQGILAGAPTDLSTIDTIPAPFDESVALEPRARGYLDINCAHCHMPGGAGDTSGLLLEYTRPFGYEVGECKTPVAAGDGAGDLEYIIVPGAAGDSILPYRMASNEPEVRMPEIGRSMVHTEGVELVMQWINAMTPKECGATELAP